MQPSRPVIREDISAFQNIIEKRHRITSAILPNTGLSSCRASNRDRQGDGRVIPAASTPEELPVAVEHGADARSITEQTNPLIE